jgi:hypothetical protein
MNGECGCRTGNGLSALTVHGYAFEEPKPQAPEPEPFLNTKSLLLIAAAVGAWWAWKNKGNKKVGGNAR